LDAARQQVLNDRESVSNVDRRHRYPPLSSM
jgi:hypothetical protein